MCKHTSPLSTVKGKLQTILTFAVQYFVQIPLLRNVQSKSVDLCLIYNQESIYLHFFLSVYLNMLEKTNEFLF